MYVRSTARSARAGFFFFWHKSTRFNPPGKPGVFLQTLWHTTGSVQRTTGSGPSPGGGKGSAGAIHMLHQPVYLLYNVTRRPRAEVVPGAINNPPKSRRESTCRGEVGMCVVPPEESTDVV